MLTNVVVVLYGNTDASHYLTRTDGIDSRAGKPLTEASRRSC